MRAGTAEASEPPGASCRRAWCRAGQREQPVLSSDGHRHHRDDPQRHSAEENHQNQVRYAYCCCTACAHCSLPTILPTAREPPGPAFWGRRRVTPRTPGTRGFLYGKPTSCAYHPIGWAGRSHWSSMTGMARSPATKRLSYPNYPAHPNLLLGLFSGLPGRQAVKLGTSQIFRTARMVPLKPLVGMAGIDGLDR